MASASVTFARVVWMSPLTSGQTVLALVSAAGALLVVAATDGAGAAAFVVWSAGWLSLSQPAAAATTRSAASRVSRVDRIVFPSPVGVLVRRGRYQRDATGVATPAGRRR